MWVMVLGDLVIFGGYFIVFMIYRSLHPDEFLRAQQHLDITMGVLNTVILLTSSWLLARAVLASRAGRHATAIRLTYAGGVGGLMFMACKGYEWVVKIRAGHTNSEMFYSVLLRAHRRPPDPRTDRAHRAGRDRCASSAIRPVAGRRWWNRAWSTGTWSTCSG